MDLQSGDEMTLATESGEVGLGAADVRTVAVRGHALAQGALIGAATCAALAFAACHDDPGCVPLAAAPIGAGAGLAIGALVPRMKTVFRTDEQPRVTLAPVMSRRGLGIRGTWRW